MGRMSTERAVGWEQEEVHEWSDALSSQNFMIESL
jgi:hypothetical protein